MAREQTYSVTHHRCEWCEAKTDLVEAFIGSEPALILICRNGKDCVARQPMVWPKGRLGVPDSCAV